MDMRKSTLLIILLFVLGGCYAEEAEDLIEEKELQEEIERAIIHRGKVDYNLNLEADVKNIKFAFPEGKSSLPLLNSERIEIPVKTIGEPEYKFKVYANIYDEEKEAYEFMRENLNFKELKLFGETLLSDVFESLYENKLKEITDFDEGIEIKNIRVDNKYSYTHFEDEAELRALRHSFADDYNKGYFNSPDKFETVLKRQMAEPSEDELKRYEELNTEGFPCTAGIVLDVNNNEASEMTGEERMRNITQFLNSSNKLPNGMYSVTVKTEGTEDTAKKRDIYEKVIICR